MERLLVAVDESPTARFVSRLVGLIAGARRIPTTMLHIEEETGTGAGRPSEATTKVKELAQVTAEAAIPDAVEPDATAPPVDITMKPRRQQLAEDVVVEEAKKGYDFLVIGAEPEPVDGAFDERIARIALGFKGPFAVAAARGVHRTDPTGRELDILVPVIGTAYSRRGAEVALALARADNGAVTALYVRRPPRRSWQGRFSRPLLAGLEGDAALRDIVALGDKLGVRVRTAVRAEGDPADAILAHLQAYRHNLLVMGVSPRQGPGLSFGSVAETMVEQADRSILLVAS
jgi:nucleotide-binding universal stress UspA family protein